MKRYNRITPEGTRDLFSSECLALRKTEQKLSQLFSSYGYREVQTPGLEFFDLFSNGARALPQEEMYKLTDLKGRLLVLRPDSTAPIARMVSGKLKGAALPLRLYYNQTVFRSNPSLKGKSDELRQMGIELVGAAEGIADLEILTTAAEALGISGAGDFRIEIGHVGFFKAIIARLGISEEEQNEIRSLIESKSYAALGDLLAGMEQTPYTDALKRLPRLFGGEEVFAGAAELAALCDELSEVLESLRNLYNGLCQLGFGDRIIIDLGLVGRMDYYTSFVFRGYISDCGDAVLSGGRYDTLYGEFGLEYPAVGFGVALDLLVKSIPQEEVPIAEVLIVAEKGQEIAAIRLHQRLSEEGKRVEISTFSEIAAAKVYAENQGIEEIIFLQEEGAE
ncbi:MAG: ATP phosphoribosyltransferase regulatory subunit [Oscillospiraceae bacterium]|nr:ATP phosphoribosyltransferase regulatory subunit [Oscillospiraceae bacterium]